MDEETRAELDRALRAAVAARAANDALALFVGEMTGRLAAAQRDPQGALQALFADATAGVERIATRPDATEQGEAMIEIMALLRLKADQALAQQIRLAALERAAGRTADGDDPEP